MTAALRTDAGELLPLALERWEDHPDEDEQSVLGRACGPVLDVGCGPGRHALALSARGVLALGVDISAAAVATARHRRCPVLQRSIFDRLPQEGRWGSALLLDGNIGIGGDPARLLRRMRHLLRPGGCVLIEVEPPGRTTVCTRARVERDGLAGPWFPWARVGLDDVDDLAGTTGWQRAWSHEGRISGKEPRWFVQLTS
jgi:SAM-dependent methyltransferase